MGSEGIHTSGGEASRLSQAKTAHRVSELSILIATSHEHIDNPQKTAGWTFKAHYVGTFTTIGPGRWLQYLDTLEFALSHLFD